MRKLILMRHSKTEPGGAGGADHARALLPSGRRDAVAAGESLARLAPPDLVLLSDSTRTRQTLHFALQGLGSLPDSRPSAALYGASPADILAELQARDTGAGTLLVIGHNPGIGDLARALAVRGDAEAITRLGERFPTSCFAVIAFDAEESWRAGAAGRLERLWTPSQDPRR